ncbi:MAG: HAD-IIB family hydrolase [Caldithrix sp.]|nr:HAD-IIB family hydrolase [Caldithrix sp.]
MADTADHKLFVLMISIHGLLRSENLELGRDADTGGQVKYVVELARALGKRSEIERVDLLTRQVIDKKVDPVYGEKEENISEGVNIVRIPAGPRRYLRKEVLWNYLDGFSDQVLQHIRRVEKVPDIIHAHYADAGYVGSQVARLLGVPFIFTGHSLGRVKKARLAEKGLEEPKMEARYNISRRIDAEEFALDTATFVVASTHQEIEEQYKLYEYYDPRRMEVIPPGVDLDRFFPPKRAAVREEVEHKINRFLDDPELPLVMALSRADERKNIETLIHAYGQNPYLKKNANLAIVAGNRVDIAAMDKGARKVLTNILLLIDKYDLYGKVAFPKEHQPEEVPDFYRLAARQHGVFVNPALTEPFGLTLLEAAASGLPVVATNDGGPNDIIGNCNNGLLIDPLNPEDMGKAIQKVVQDKHYWKKLSQNGLVGVEKFYSWKSHVSTYIPKLENVLKRRHYGREIISRYKSRMPTVDRIILTDIDNTLLGDTKALQEFLELLNQAEHHIGFGIATGRHLEDAIQTLNENHVPLPDFFITSVGSEIQYQHGEVEDRSWRNHLNYYWKPEKIYEILDEEPGLTRQPQSEQRRYKISYYYDAKKAPKKRQLMRKLREKKLRVKIIISRYMYLDILPIRASKGLALRYLSMKWGLAPERIFVAGDSGNDEEMLLGDTLGVVVGNHSKELRRLYGKPRIYFAEGKYARGIVEGIEYYNFLEEIRIPEEENDQTFG